MKSSITLVILFAVTVHAVDETPLRQLTVHDKHDISPEGDRFVKESLTDFASDAKDPQICLAVYFKRLKEFYDTTQMSNKLMLNDMDNMLKYSDSLDKILDEYQETNPAIYILPMGTYLAQLEQAITGFNQKANNWKDYVIFPIEWINKRLEFIMDPKIRKDLREVLTDLNSASVIITSFADDSLFTNEIIEGVFNNNKLPIVKTDVDQIKQNLELLKDSVNLLKNEFIERLCRVTTNLNELTKETEEENPLVTQLLLRLEDESENESNDGNCYLLDTVHEQNEIQEESD